MLSKRVKVPNASPQPCAEAEVLLVRALPLLSWV